MSAVLLSAHVILAILAIGPIAVAASVFSALRGIARGRSGRAGIRHSARATRRIGRVRRRPARDDHGILNLLWVTVTILMIVRPGSTAGV
jgi:hypothetical protein